MQQRDPNGRSPFLDVVELAMSQFGRFSKVQSSDLGVSDDALHRALKAGKIERDLPTVYRLPGSPCSWEAGLVAAHLWLGSTSVVSHASAAALWKMPGFKRGAIELSTAHRKKPLPPVVVHSMGADLIAHTTTVGPIPVTNPGRTLVDIAGVLQPDGLEAAMEDAIRRRLTSVAHLRWLMQGRCGRGAKGVATLRKLVEGAGPTATESHFEMKLLQALRRANLPEPVRQYEVRQAGRVVARLDFAYPWAQVAIEADSYTFHSGRAAWEADLERRASLTALGWLVIHVTHRQMRSGMSQVAARVRTALAPTLPTL